MRIRNYPLDRLTIKGYKSIQNLDDLALRNLNLFIGANGSGKSNLISFFRMLRAVIDGNLNEFIRKGGGISDFLFNGRKTTAEMFFELHFGSTGYRFSIEPGPGEECTLTNEARYDSNDKHGWCSLGESRNGQSRLVQESLNDPLQDGRNSNAVYTSISSWQIYHFHDTGETAPMRHAEIVQDNRVLRVNGSNIAPYLLTLRNEHASEYRQIRDAIRLVMPFFDDFLLDVQEYGPKEKINLSWRQTGSDYPMQPYHLSDGSIRFICLTTALLQPNPPSTIIIDEPELGLHPTAISILAELMQSAATRTQLIVATQSPALIDCFDIENIVVVRRKEGASTFERLHENDYSVWLEQYSPGELWSKNVIAGGPAYE